MTFPRLIPEPPGAQILRKLIVSLCLIICAVSTVTVHAKTPGGKRLIEDIQRAYKELETFSCSFRQEFQWALAGEVEVTEGTMEMADSDRFRFETPHQVMATDGETLWRWSLANYQVIVENLFEAEPGILPREILFDYPKMFRIEDVEEAVIGGRPAYMLLLVPHSENMGVNQVRVWIDAEDSITRRMEWTDEMENRTTYILKDIQINPHIPDERFQVTIPEGVTVYDLR